MLIVEILKCVEREKKIQMAQGLIHLQPESTLGVLPSCLFPSCVLTKHIMYLDSIVSCFPPPMLAPFPCGQNSSAASLNHIQFEKGMNGVWTIT